jgi:hypothetical protein
VKYTISAFRHNLPWADLTIDPAECWRSIANAFVPFLAGRPLSEAEFTRVAVRGWVLAGIVVGFLLMVGGH